MRRGWYGALAILCLLIVLQSCSKGGIPGPTAPPAPTIANVAGVWAGVSTLTSATGCGCVGAAYQAWIGNTANSTAQINQNGSAITARITDDTTGLWCDSTGTIGSETFVLNTTDCASGGLRITCSNGNKRDIFQVSGSRQGTVSGNSASGTGGDTYNCYNSITGANAGVLNLGISFRMNRG